MGKIESETRKQIMNYYDEKIGEIEEEQRKLKKLIEEKQIDEFYNDEEVIHVKEELMRIKEKYESLSLSLKCEVYSTWSCSFNYENNKYYKENQNKILKLKKEKRNLLLTLENNAKTSNEYKKAINDFIKKVK